MKKLIVLVLCLFGILSATYADSDKPIKVNQMPQEAQQFIKTHFADQRIAMAKVESDWFDKNYDVIFTNGDKVEFDKQGNWKEVDCKYGSVPMGIIPTPVRKYVAEQYPGAGILKLERDKKGYEVKLSTKLKLKFDLNFNLTEVDD